MNTDIDFTITGHGASDPEFLFFVPDNIRLYTGKFGIDILVEELKNNDLINFIYKIKWNKDNFRFITREYLPGSICPDNLISFQGFWHELIGGLLPIKEIKNILTPIIVDKWSRDNMDGNKIPLTTEEYIDKHNEFMHGLYSDTSEELITTYNHMYPTKDRTFNPYKGGIEPTLEEVQTSMHKPVIRDSLEVLNAESKIEKFHVLNNTSFYFNLYPIDHPRTIITAGPKLAYCERSGVINGIVKNQNRLSQILKWLSGYLKTKYPEGSIFNVLLISCRGQNTTRYARGRPTGPVSRVPFYKFNYDIRAQYDKCKVDFGDNIFDGTFLKNLDYFELDPDKQSETLLRRHRIVPGIAASDGREPVFPSEEIRERQRLDYEQGMLRREKSYSGIKINNNNLKELIRTYEIKLEEYSLSPNDYKLQYEINEDGKPFNIFTNRDERYNLETFIENLELIKRRYNKEDFKGEFNRIFKIYLNIKKILNDFMLFPVYQFCEILYFSREIRKILYNTDILFATGLLITDLSGNYKYNYTERQLENLDIRTLKAIVGDREGYYDQFELYQIKQDGTMLLTDNDSLVNDLEKDIDDKIELKMILKVEESEGKAGGGDRKKNKFKKRKKTRKKNKFKKRKKTRKKNKSKKRKKTRKK